MERDKNKNKMIVEYEEGIMNKSMKPNINYYEKIKEIPIDAIKARKQSRVEIKGVEVYFPYPPYSNQLAYMEKVIDACNTGNLAALESPTGTGKTLCLLCASLGWLRGKRKQMRDKVIKMDEEEAIEFAKTSPFIYYTSRTHSQLANVIKELKKTCYLPKTATLSSRDQMCVNTAVKQFSGNTLNIKCKQVRLKKECKYFFGAEKLSSNAYENMDIEELYQLGSKSGFCPFYFQRNKKEYADVLFMPYNYIFEAKFRKALKIEMQNAIVLIDEAHNMESVCESSKSFEFSVKMIDDCLMDFNGIKRLLEFSEVGKESALKGVDVKKVKEQEVILNNMKKYLKGFTLRTGNGWPNFGLKLSAKEFFDIFYEGSKGTDKNQTTLINSTDDSGPRITPDNILTHVELLKKIDTFISDELQKSSILSNYSDILALVSDLSLNYFQILKSGDKNPLSLFINNYKIFLNDVEDPTNIQKNNNYNNKNNSNSKDKIRTLFLFCFNPGFGFADVIKSGAQTVIITSGTLSPIESVETELKCNFQIKLENKHVVDKCQVNFSILANSFRRKVNFKFDANSRSNTEMIEELGHTISDLIKVTPGGVLVFFSSYMYMNNCIHVWAEKEILSEIEKSKEIFKDVQDSTKNKIVLKSFQETCTTSTENVPNYRKQKKGGILFSVCRGSSSEGIDFSDDMARMVIIVGIPYANLGDVKVNLKKEYLDEYNNKYFNYLDKTINIKKLTASEWYTQTATKAVNQAIGRVIRHIDDYGSMILIDCRYKELLYKKVFSVWLRDSCKVYDDSKLLTDTRGFYENMKNYICDKKVKRKEKKSIEVEENILPNSGNNFTNTININRTNNINNINTSDSHKSNNNYLSRNYSVTDDEDLNSILNRNNDNLIKRSKKGLTENNNINISNIQNNNVNNNFTHEKNEDRFKMDITPNNYSVNTIPNNKINTISTNPAPTTTDIINDIKSTIDNLNNIKNDISSDISKINKVTSKTINININQNNNNYLIFPSKPSVGSDSADNSKKTLGSGNKNSNINNFKQTQLNFSSQNKNLNISYNFNSNKNNIPQIKQNIIQSEEENIFDAINSDDLMNIINDNINYFEDNENINDNIIINPRLSTSKKKVFKQYPSENKNENISMNRNNLNNIISPSHNNLGKVFSDMTPAKKNNSQEEIKSEAIVKKLLELKDRDQLDILLEKYNLKLCFDSQVINDDGKSNDLSKNKEFVEQKEINNNKKFECPICFESENRKYKAAKCGHILCTTCWDRCLEFKFECPMCKKKTRLSNLVSIFI